MNIVRFLPVIVMSLFIFVLGSYVLSDYRALVYILNNGGIRIVKQRYQEEKYKCENAGHYVKECDTARVIRGMFD